MNHWDNNGIMVDTVGGRYPAPVDTWFLPLFIGFNHPK